MIIEPETVTHAKKQAAKQRQLERRGIARDFINAMLQNEKTYFMKDIVKEALEVADELLEQTKVDEP